LQERTAPLSSPRQITLHHQLLGEMALLRGDSPRAIEELERAAKGLWARGAGPDGGRHVRLWFSLASAHLLAGDRAEALAWFQRIADSGWEHVNWPLPYVRSFYFLGTIHESQGDAGRAREHF
jgi:tetratricopeptide (TPR) repeat protein